MFTGIGCCSPTCGWGWLPTQRQTAQTTDANQNMKGLTQTQSSRERVTQVRFQITLPTIHFDQGMSYEILKR